MGTRFLEPVANRPEGQWTLGFSANDRIEVPDSAGYLRSVGRFMVRSARGPHPVGNYPFEPKKLASRPYEWPCGPKEPPDDGHRLSYPFSTVATWGSTLPISSSTTDGNRWLYTVAVIDGSEWPSWPATIRIEAPSLARTEAHV